VLGVGTISELLNGRIATQVLLLNLSPRATKSVLIPELKRMSACSLGGYLQKTRQRLLRRGGQEEVKDSGKFYLFCWETTKGYHCQWFSEVRRIVLKMQTHLFMNVCVAYDYHLQKHQMWNSKGACVSNIM
jgi:hypothetical protein